MVVGLRLRLRMCVCLCGVCARVHPRCVSVGALGCVCVCVG